MRSPSSLIFIVLIGVWAAYFVQYWIRRRDHLSTARSVDQFTEAMRVLERRDVTPYADLSAPARPSYSVHPERSARPQVLVKRAVPAEARRGTETAVPVHVSPVGREGAATRAAAPSASGQGSSRESRARIEHGIRPSRRVRGVFLLAALLELLVIVPLVAVSMVSAWVLLPSLLAPVWAVAWLRSGVRTEQAAVRARRRRGAERTHERAAAPAPTRVAGGRTQRSSEVRATSTLATSTPAMSTAATSTLATPTVSEATTDVFDADAAAPAAVADQPSESVVAHAAALPEAPVVVAPSQGSGTTSPVAPEVPVPLVDEDDIPLTWNPVPVPRPTYTMKAKAERVAPAPAATTPRAAPTEPAEPAELAELAEDTAYDERRAVAGA
ncbi:MAG: hypothetical protein ABIQ61_10255 [Ornithinibacter sp.]